MPDVLWCGFFHKEEHTVGFLTNVTMTCGMKNSRLGLNLHIGTYDVRALDSQNEQAMWLRP